MPVPRLEAIPDPELRRRAAEFLERYWPNSEIPIDFEQIVNIQLAIDILPTPRLSELNETDGFITSDGRRIYMDEQIHRAKTKYTYLFMLAHEVAHLVLHQPLLAAAGYETMTEWKRFHDGLPEDDRQRFEYEATVFAGSRRLDAARSPNRSRRTNWRSGCPIARPESILTESCAPPSKRRHGARE